MLGFTIHIGKFSVSVVLKKARRQSDELIYTMEAKFWIASFMILGYHTYAKIATVGDQGSTRANKSFLLQIAQWGRREGE